MAIKELAFSWAAGISKGKGWGERPGNADIAMLRSVFQTFIGSVEHAMNFLLPLFVLRLIGGQFYVS